MTKQYEVEKFQRGMDGKYFGRGARRFRSLTEAREYFEDFVAGQQDVLDNGLKIILRERAGRKTLAVAGGLLDAAQAKLIRWVDA